MASITYSGVTFNTTAGSKTLASITPAVGNLIVVVAATSGLAGGTTSVTDDNSDGLGAYTQVDSDRTGFSTTGVLTVWVRNRLVGSATSTTFTAAQVGSTGGGLAVFRVAGMTRVGSAAVKSNGGQSTGGAGTTPAPVLSATPLLTNPIISSAANGSGVASITQRSGYSEAQETAYISPATNLETNYLNSGETSATLTYGGTSATAFASVGIELNTAPFISFTETATPGEAAPTITITGPLSINVSDAAGTPGEVVVGLGTHDDIALMNYASTGSHTTNPVVFSATNSAGNNAALIVGVGLRGAASVSTITFGAQSLTKIGRYAPGADVCVEMWWLQNPNMGTYDITVTNSTIQTCEVVAGFFNNVDSPYSNTNSSSVLPGTSITTNVESWSGFTLIDMCMLQSGNSSLAKNASQTLVAIPYDANGRGGMSYKAATHGTNSMNWTFTSDYAAHWVTAFKPKIHGNIKIAAVEGVSVGEEAAWLQVPPVGSDQFQPIFNYSYQDFGVSTTWHTKVAQSFKPSVTGPIRRLTIELSTEGSPTDNVLVGIYSNNGGIPGTLIGTAGSYPGTSLTGSRLPYDFYFYDVWGVAETTYWIVLTSDSPAYDEINYYYTTCGYPTSYSRGSYFTYTSSTWVDDNTDLFFTEYPASTSLSISVFDEAQPGEAFSRYEDTVIVGEVMQISVSGGGPAPVSITVSDGATPGEIINVTQSSPRISVSDNTTPTEVFDARHLTIDKYSTSEAAYINFGDNTYHKTGQVWFASMAGNISTIAVKLNKTGNPVDNLSLGVYTVMADGTTPNALIATADNVINGANISAGGEVWYFRFDPGDCDISAGKVAFVIQRSGGYDASNYYGLRMGFGSGTGGQFILTDSGDTWTTGAFQSYFIEYLFTNTIDGYGITIAETPNTPGEVIAAAAISPTWVSISVADGTTADDLVNSQIPKNYISVADNTAPTDTVNIYANSYNVSVSDGNTPGEIIDTQIPRNYISVSDGTTPNEVVIAQIPKNYVSVLDAATPGENATIVVPKYYISVVDSTTPSEVIAAQIPVNYISVSDTTTPGESIDVTIPGPRISVADGATPGEVIATQIPRNYISVNDGASPGDTATVQIPTNYISVNDGANPGEVSNLWIPKNYVSCTDTATPGETVDLYAPKVYISVADTTAPTEVMSIYGSSPNIPWTDNFDDNSLNLTKWTASSNVGSTITEQNQRLEFTSSATVSAYVRSTTAYAPQRTTLILNVIQHCEDGGFKLCPTDPAGHMWDVYSEANWYNFQMITGNILSPCKKVSGGAIEQIGGDSPGMTAPFWMRMRIDDGKIYFDYVDNQASEPSESQWVNISSETWSLGSAITDTHYTYVTAYNTPTTGQLFIDNFSWRNFTPALNLTETATPGEIVNIYLPKYYVSVSDGTQATDTVNAAIPAPGYVSINVNDGASPGEVISTYLPRLYTSVFDTTTPTEVINVAVSSPRISVLDSIATPGEVILVRASNPLINVSDTATPVEAISVTMSNPRISVVDSTTPNEVVTAQIPRNYITVTDQATPGEVVIAHVPKNYINVTDATAPAEVVNVSLPTVAYYNISVIDSAAPGEVSNILIPTNYINVYDSAAPGEVVNILVNNLAIVVIDSLAAGEVISLLPSFVPWYDILVIDVARPGDKRKVAKSHTGIGPHTPHDWYVEAPAPFQTKNNGDWYEPDPKTVGTKNNPDWYEKY